jgi:hypothetical protein
MLNMSVVLFAENLLSKRIPWIRSAYLSPNSIDKFAATKLALSVLLVLGNKSRHKLNNLFKLTTRGSLILGQRPRTT